MLQRILIEFEVPAKASCFLDDVEQARYPERAVVEGRPHRRVDVLVRMVKPPRGKDKDASGLQGMHEFQQQRSLFFKSDMPNAVPGRDEAIGALGAPAADVGMMQKDRSEERREGKECRSRGSSEY